MQGTTRFRLSLFCLVFGLASLGQAQVLPAVNEGSIGGASSIKASLNLKFVAKSLTKEADAFRQDWPGLESASGKRVDIALDRSLAEEEYHLDLGATVKLRAGSKIGAAWGLQTLGQLASQGISNAQIKDKPDINLRIVNLDVARRFHSISTLRQAVRWCQAAKVNFIQLHLTDDQNWMLPTKVLSGIDKNNTHRKPAYSEQELKSLIEYAEARGVRFIPEIDLPGHSTLLVKHNPEVFSIKGSQSTNCINFGSAEVRKTLKTLIRETATIFKYSPYLHIGGDEAWYPDAEKDPQIAKMMSILGEGIGPHEIFVDFVADLAQEAINLDRTPIVWEGFGPTTYAQNRIPKQTIVVAWEDDYYPAKRLVEDGFRVLNAGWDPLYVVNHYPYDSFTLVPLTKMYQFDPFVFDLVNWSGNNRRTLNLPKDGKMEGAVMSWWEGHEWNAHTTLPHRIAAFGSRLWNKEGETDFAGFMTRSNRVLEHIKDTTFGFPVMIRGSRKGSELQFEEKAHISTLGSAEIQFGYRTDGEIPKASDIKEDGVEITSSSIVTIQAFADQKPIGETKFLKMTKVKVVPNLAMGAKVVSNGSHDPQFSAELLTDGVADEISSFWISYPIPASFTLNFGKSVEFNRIELVPFWASGGAIQYTIETSQDGVTWKPVVDATGLTEAPTVAGNLHRFSTASAHYIRVTVTGTKQFPPSIARVHEIRVFKD